MSGRRSEIDRRVFGLLPAAETVSKSFAWSLSGCGRPFAQRMTVVPFGRSTVFPGDYEQ